MWLSRQKRMCRTNPGGTTLPTSSRRWPNFRWSGHEWTSADFFSFWGRSWQALWRRHTLCFRPRLSSGPAWIISSGPLRSYYWLSRVLRHQCHLCPGASVPSQRLRTSALLLSVISSSPCTQALGFAPLFSFRLERPQAFNNQFEGSRGRTFKHMRSNPTAAEFQCRRIATWRATRLWLGLTAAAAVAFDARRCK